MIIESFITFHKRRLLNEMPHLQVDPDEDKETSYFDLEIEQGAESLKEKDPEKYVSWEDLQKKLKTLWKTGDWTNKVGRTTNYGEKNKNLFLTFISKHPDDNINDINSGYMMMFPGMFKNVYKIEFEEFTNLIKDITKE